jgi:peptide/nickel transport system ATP-binding protein
MPLVEVRHLTKTFARPHGWFRQPDVITAVDDVSFDIETGETFGLVGESGSGKTTTGRCILRLIEPTSGEVRFKGEDVLGFSATRLRASRRDMQIVFQDPYSSLNPRMRVGSIVAEPLVIHRVGDRGAQETRAAELLQLVGLEPSMTKRYPREFSGGQRQRIAIARALALNPSFLIADEPVSSLDMTVQAQVMDLFLDLQRRLKLTCLFIAHDLRLVEHVCTRLAVMYRGRIVEMGPSAAVFGAPKHAYTKALLSAIPVPDPTVKRQRIAFDDAAIDRSATLRAVGDGHFAAI